MYKKFKNLISMYMHLEFKSDSLAEENLGWSTTDT